MFEQTQIQEFKEAFTLIDQNRDGFIDKEDLKDTYASLGKLNVKDKELEEMLKEATGPINFTMFLTLFGEKLHGTDPEDTILNAFKMFDPNLKGFIHKDELQRALMTQADKFTSEESLRPRHRVSPSSCLNPRVSVIASSSSCVSVIVCLRHRVSVIVSQSSCLCHRVSVIVCLRHRVSQSSCLCHRVFVIVSQSSCVSILAFPSSRLRHRVSVIVCLRHLCLHHLVSVIVSLSSCLRHRVSAIASPSSCLFHRVSVIVSPSSCLRHCVSVIVCLRHRVSVKCPAGGSLSFGEDEEGQRIRRKLQMFSSWQTDSFQVRKSFIINHLQRFSVESHRPS
ncbi:myosin light chain 5-like [Scomber scombrus]|uniref:Myosin light chain 5-like n=1 Tax=Scomber scombrus TaxID=13677 RepID=A0AAV1Q7Y7_SCOSC